MRNVTVPDAIKLLDSTPSADSQKSSDSSANSEVGNKELLDDDLVQIESTIAQCTMITNRSHRAPKEIDKKVRKDDTSPLKRYPMLYKMEESQTNAGSTREMGSHLLKSIQERTLADLQQTYKIGPKRLKLNQDLPSATMKKETFLARSQNKRLRPPEPMN